jgi:methionyl-tRNA formyltransferase
MKENTDLDVLVMSLKSGEYDGTSIMQAYIAIERLMKIEEELDTLKASLPKIKADAVREAIAECNYNGADGQGWQSDLEQYANKLEAGE